MLARLSCYSASVFVVYLVTTELDGSPLMIYLDAFLIGLAAFLMLAIRMSRKEQFRLDTQDLLILLMVVIVPQLPFSALESFSIGHIALRLSVLMYGCEFLLAREGQDKIKYLSIGSIVGLFAIGLTAF
ncbi:hypothetical protein [Oceanicoccus sp. KOV_DT_Chl]|uniref:hypothetical protein n=1 Tax=Oceanicoccus sp. KOV_DT_Chl TaxID=1904639 RepID=UPI000C79F00A|nr:hypothetical protein [Oceanicoccus sp. KOV_DT_Chl]